jgi:hypothetical protein
MVGNGKDGHIQHTKGVNATMHLAAATESSIACGAAAIDSSIVFGAAAMDSGIACGAGAMDSSIAFGAGAMGSSISFGAAALDCSIPVLPAAGTAWGASGSSASPAMAGPVALPLPALVSEQLVQPAPRTKRARLVCPVKAGPPAFSFAPYDGHLAVKLGRCGLWCLRCFSKPACPYQAWLRERCSDERPLTAMPGGLSAALLRAGPLDANASEGVCRRHALLLGAARVVPVPAAAFQLEGQAGGRQVQEH